MCLILVAWKTSAEFPVVVAANRDEFHARAAAPAAFWDDHPEILAGRDLEARGTWMGISRDGRFAAVTNYRGAREPRAAESRGKLVSRFLHGTDKPGDYIGGLAGKASAYSGFNLLAADGEELWWMSNRDGTPRRLEPGVYGLGNALLDSPDVEPRKRRFQEVLSVATAVEPLFSVLAEAKIVDPVYGTRCSSVYFGRPRSVQRYAERSYSPDGADQDTVHYQL